MKPKRTLTLEQDKTTRMWVLTAEYTDEHGMRACMWWIEAWKADLQPLAKALRSVGFPATVEVDKDYDGTPGW